ncbi:hypothetical protein [Dactylosporangium sp. NPDC048998]|uniref:hypothetical protein n=1 Tax=Dactylosporangium sp. NPDC048998 TaxID=3363976 RepID=UPI003713EBD2
MCTRPGDAADRDGDARTATAGLDLAGPVTTRPWSDGFSVGWHVEGLHNSRYVYLTPSADGDSDDDVADVHVYVSDSDDPHDAGTVLWLPVHDRTAEPLISAGPVTGPGIVFDPAAFADWFRTADVQQTLPGLVTGPYHSADPDDSAAVRAQLLLLEHVPAAVWRLGAGVSNVTIWPTTDAEGAPAGDGGAVITVRYGPVELSAGHLAADELVRSVYAAGSGTIGATALHAATQALTAVAERVNHTIRHLADTVGLTAVNTAIPAAAAADATTDDAPQPPVTATATATPDADTPGGVPVNLVTGRATKTIRVDPDLDDALVIVAVGDPDGHLLDVVGIDLNANTVGVWTGPDPDNQDWTVVAHLDAAQIREHRRPPTIS